MKKLLFLPVFFAVLLGALYAQDSSGTGFFINGDGVLVTNNHVIEGGREFMAVVGGREYPAELIAKDEENDLAVLKIAYRNPNHFKISDFGALELGTELSILGFPLTNYVTEDIRYTEGSLSARSGLKSTAESWFQHSVPTQPGNSGGPIFNSRFEVVGVAVAIIDAGKVLAEMGVIPQNVNFGVKSDYIFPLLGRISPGQGNIRSIGDAEKATVMIRVYNTASAGFSFTVANSTGYTGKLLYVSPRTSDSWGYDHLDSRALYDGDSFSVRNVPASEGNRYDLRLVDSDDDSYTMWNVLIQPNQTIEFTFENFDEAEDSDYSEEEEPAPVYNGPPVNIVNNTGKTIYYLYVSPSSSDSWDEDRLGADVLSRGDSVSVRLPYALSHTNRYDFKVEDSDGNIYTKFRVTVSANSRITFTAGDLEGGESRGSSGSSSRPTITVTNDTGFTFYYLHISPSSSNSWGEDWLGSEVLDSGDSTTIELPHTLSATSSYDFKAEDSDGDTYTKRNVTVTANGRIRFTLMDIDY